MDRNAPVKSPMLAALGQALVGSWRLSGGVSGVVAYTWAEGGFFLIQDIDIAVFGRHVVGREIIGHLRGISGPPSEEVWSRFYSFNDGLTLDYVYEIEGRTLRIFFQRKDSNNSLTATFSEDGRSYVGAWAWPGGGYEVRADKVR